jgi:membrane protein implicated in regulation of membrane protease activity
MNGRFQTPGRLSTNPFVQALSFLLLGIALIGAVLMGAIVIAFLVGLFAILGVVVWIRLWWLRRRMLRARGGSRARRDQGSQRSGRIIEVEYEVVDRRRDEKRRE